MTCIRHHFAHQGMQEADDPFLTNVFLVLAELVVRTTYLMLAVEESVEQQMNISGKAMIFGSFATGTAMATTTSSATVP